MLPWLTPRPPLNLDVRAIREASGHGQSTFAAVCGVSVRTLQGWEQGRRKPTGAARALLMVIAHDPEAYVQAAIAAMSAAKG
jgi:putative transcriptional regulator